MGKLSTGDLIPTFCATSEEFCVLIGSNERTNTESVVIGKILQTELQTNVCPQHYTHAQTRQDSINLPTLV